MALNRHPKEAVSNITGSGEVAASYSVPDDQMAAGSTLGAPKCALIVKATGAIEKFYSIDAGKAVFCTLLLHHWDEDTGIALIPMPGEFIIHPERQEHQFLLFNGVSVYENIFVLSGMPDGKRVDPPAAYYVLELRNDTEHDVRLATYASLQLRGDSGHDVSAAYSAKHRALIAWNDSEPDLARAFATSVEPLSYEVTLSAAKSSAARFPGTLSNRTVQGAGDPVGMFHFRHHLKAGQHKRLFFTLTFSQSGRAGAVRELGRLPSADEALARTRKHYDAVLNRAVVITPDQDVNRGVLWAKANMLRIQSAFAYRLVLRQRSDALEQ